MVLENIQNFKINLPFVGTIGVAGIGIGLVLVYFLVIKKGRLTSKTVTTRFR